MIIKAALSVFLFRCLLYYGLVCWIVQLFPAVAAPPAADLWKQTYSTYPDITYRKLHDLKSDTVYLVTIWAETNSRRGQELTIEEATVSEDGFYLAIEAYITAFSLFKQNPIYLFVQNI